MRVSSRPSTPSVAPDETHRRGLPYTARSHLFWLVIVCVVPAALAAWLAILRAYDQGTEEISSHAMSEARAVVGRADAEFAVAIAALRVLAKSPSLLAGDYARFHAQARLTLTEVAGEVMVLSDADGQQIVNTWRTFGEPLPRHSDPAMLRRVVDSGQPVVSNLFYGSVAKHPMVGVWVPVTVDGRVTHVLGMGFKPTRLGQVLQISGRSWLVGLFDREGAIVARSEGSERLIGQKGAPALTEALRQQSEGTLVTTSLEGVSMLVAFSRSPVSGWSATVGVPQQVLRGELRRWLSALLVTSAALLLLGGLAAAWIARRIKGSIEGLVAPSEALFNGEPVLVPPLHLKEADRVGAALSRTATLLDARTRERDEATQRNRQLRDVVRRDTLTGLLNRSAFAEAVEARTGGEVPFTIFFVDLDDFKQVNDELGHTAGDQLLHAFATRLKAGVRDTDAVARLGGDEFAVLVDGLDGAAAEPIARNLLDRLRQPYRIGAAELKIRASVGLSEYPRDGTDVTALLDAADRAMYAAKAAGKGDYRRSGDTVS